MTRPLLSTVLVQLGVCTCGALSSLQSIDPSELHSCSITYNGSAYNSDLSGEAFPAG